jgi:ketosteroid isomerase-like protein
MTAGDVTTDIRQQLSRYMRAMRMKDLDAMAEVFTDDAIIDYSAIGGGRASWPETRTFLEATLGGVQQFLLHTADIFIELAPDGTTAEVETTWHGVFVPLGDGPPLLVFGTYEDMFRRVADGWRIAVRVDRPAVQLPVPASSVTA